jgi:SulP family sulfate permease
VAGIVHALTLLLIMLLVGKWATLIPMSCLAGILIIVAYNMSEYRTFIEITKTSRSDALVLITTFLLTVFFDLTVAIEIGMVLAVFLFMRTMIQISNVSPVLQEKQQGVDYKEMMDPHAFMRDVETFEITGPFFFGAAYKFREAIRVIQRKPKILIVRMDKVPVIDATGTRTIRDILHTCKKDNIHVIVSGVQPPVLDEFKRSRLLFRIGKRYVTHDIATALNRAKEVIERDRKNK